MKLWYIFTLLIIIWASEIMFTGHFEKYAFIAIAFVAIIFLNWLLKHSKTL